LYFQNVINWVKATFKEYRPEMQRVEWGEWYNEFQGQAAGQGK